LENVIYNKLGYGPADVMKKFHCYANARGRNKDVTCYFKFITFDWNVGSLFS
jgi:hypothetical protein